MGKCAKWWGVEARKRGVFSLGGKGKSRRLKGKSQHIRFFRTPGRSNPGCSNAWRRRTQGCRRERKEIQVC